jgi:hypothetical protein
MAGDRPSALALLGHSPESSRHEKMEVRGAVKPRSSGGNQSVGSGLPARSSMAIRPGPFAPKIWNALHTAATIRAPGGVRFRDWGKHRRTADVRAQSGHSRCSGRKSPSGQNLPFMRRSRRCCRIPTQLLVARLPRTFRSYGPFRSANSRRSVAAGVFETSCNIALSSCPRRNSARTNPITRPYFWSFCHRPSPSDFRGLATKCWRVRRDSNS